MFDLNPRNLAFTISGWTSEKIAEFVRLHAEGLSFSAIGSQIGCSRNAAIGKAHRMGLERRMPTRSERPKRERIRQHRVQRFREVLPMPIPDLNGDAASAGLCDITGQEAGSPTRPLPASTTACTLMELGPTTCRWPLWSDAKPEHLYCDASGADLENKLPYCRHHRRMAYQPRRAA